MTNRSSGGYTAKYELLFKGDVGGLRIKKGENLVFNFTEKLPVYLKNPDEFLGLLDDAFGTENNPFRTGSRDVAAGGKFRRAIFMQELKEYIWSRWIFFLLEYHQNSVHEIDGTEKAYSIWSSWAFTSGKEKGIILHDHVWSAIATSDPMMITIDKDFAKFDSHQLAINSRRPMIEAFEEIMGAWVASFGPWENLVTMVKKLLGPGRGTERWYKSKGINKGKTEAVYKYNGLGSGESITLNQNNLVNIGLQKDMYHNVVNSDVTLSEHGKRGVYKFTDLFNLKRIQIMGDDEQETWIDVNNKWSLGIHRQIVTGKRHVCHVRLT